MLFRSAFENQVGTRRNVFELRTHRVVGARRVPDAPDGSVRVAEAEQHRALYAESLAKDPDKGYTYASMASAQYWRGDYAQAWADVKLAEFNDGHVPPKFLALLGDKLKRPD